MATLGEKLNIDWMLKDKDQAIQSKESSIQPSIADSLILYARDVLECLSKAPNGRAGVHDIAGTLDGEVTFKEVLDVVDYLAARGDVEIVEHSKVGNDKLQLTQSGADLVGRRLK